MLAGKKQKRDRGMQRRRQGERKGRRKLNNEITE